MDDMTRAIEGLKSAEVALTRAASYLLDHNQPEGQRALDAAKSTMAIVTDIAPYTYSRK